MNSRELEQVIALIQRLAVGPVVNKNREDLITLNEYHILSLMTTLGEVDGAALCKTMGMPQSTFYGIINRMIGRGLVEKTHHAFDGRKRMLLPTARGKRRMRRIRSQNAERMNSMPSVWRRELEEGLQMAANALLLARHEYDSFEAPDRRMPV